MLELQNSNLIVNSLKFGAFCTSSLMTSLTISSPNASYIDRAFGLGIELMVSEAMPRVTGIFHLATTSFFIILNTSFRDSELSEKLRVFEHLSTEVLHGTSIGLASSVFHALSASYFIKKYEDMPPNIQNTYPVKTALYGFSYFSHLAYDMLYYCASNNTKRTISLFTSQFVSSVFTSTTIKRWQVEKKFIFS